MFAGPICDSNKFNIISQKKNFFLLYGYFLIVQWRRSGVFSVNFEHISHLVLVFLFLTLSR